MKKEEASVELRRGTPAWGYKVLKEDLMVKLMDDIHSLRITGLSEDKCDFVKSALGKIVNCVSVIPDTFLFRKPLLCDFEKFERLYSDWNNIEGELEEDEASRSKILGKMRKTRQKIATKSRRHYFILSKNLDLKLIEASYDSMNELVSKFPELFVNIGRAINNFNRKKNKLKKITNT